MVLQSKDPVLGFPMDQGRLMAVVEIVSDEQAEFAAEPDLPTADDAAVRAVAHLLGCDYGDAHELLMLAMAKAVDAMSQQHGVDTEDEQSVSAMIDENAAVLNTLVFSWLDGAVIGLRYADVEHKKVLLVTRETDA